MLHYFSDYIKVYYYANNEKEDTLEFSPLAVMKKYPDHERSS